MDSRFDDLQEDILEDNLEIYSKTAVDHFMNPRNLGEMEDYDGFARSTGPCGDSISIWIKVKDNIISEISFTTDGCGPSISSASMVTTLAKGKTIEEARKIGQWDVLNALEGLPEEKEHCSLLAATSLMKAMDDFSASKN